MNNNFFGCYISYPSLNYDATEKDELLSKEQGDLFSSYIWGQNGIDIVLKKMKHDAYGQDLVLILLQFYINPIPFELENLKEIESYRKKEKSIGIPIIVTDNNFFNKSEEGRYSFLKQSILQKMVLLAEVIKKKKLDTNVELLTTNLNKIL